MRNPPARNSTSRVARFTRKHVPRFAGFGPFIDTTSPYLCKGWPLWRLPPLPVVFSVRLGRRFEPSEDPLAQLAEIEAYMRAGLQENAR